MKLTLWLSGPVSSMLEAGSQWLPFVLQELARGTLSGARKQDTIEEGMLGQNRIYVACQVDDDLSYTVRFTGADNLVIGTDFGHADLGTDLAAHQIIKERLADDPKLANKIVNDNARRLYAF